MKELRGLLEVFPDYIAYFSMEIGLEERIPTYSGGLGVLAGDAIKSAADLKLPLVGVTLISKKGYFKQELTPEGRQIEHYVEWNPKEFMELLPQEVEVEIEGRSVNPVRNTIKFRKDKISNGVKIKAWLYIVEGSTGGRVPIFFLDTDVEGNSEENRGITHHLYGGDARYRLKQEIVLGIGGVRILEELGIKVRKYHMNEGHSSLLTVELLKRYNLNVDTVRNLCVFTTHTPAEAGHDKFSYELVREVLGEFINFETLKELGGKDYLNMTLLALNLSDNVNGVSKRHKEVSQKMFSAYQIHAITNGIHSYTWTCESFRRLYDKYLPGWANEPELLVRVEIIPNEEIWQGRFEAKKELIDYVNSKASRNFSYDIFTIGFARRATLYKRHNLLFSDLERLKKINQKYKFQVIFAGKAHPKDEPGKKMIEENFSCIERLKDEINIVYLPDYDIEMAKKLTSGVDLWLNTPKRSQEASGTSGMKAAHNGVINFSVLDGWWIEGWVEGVTGWAIGPSPDEELKDEELYRREIEDLYNKLEYVILPMHYEQRDKWVLMIENSIGKIAYFFNSHRMVRRYITEAYF